MRLALGIGVLLASLGTALVGVREQGENRRLEYDVWGAMRRRDALERQIREVEALIDETLSPRRLLEEAERRGLPRVDETVDTEPGVFSTVIATAREGDDE